MARKTVDGAVKRLLVYGNRKCDPTYWDASTPELEAGAFLALFKILDEDWHVYANLTEEPYQPSPPKDHPEGCMCEECKVCRTYKDRAPKEAKNNEKQLEAYKAAKAGDADAARRLLTARKDGEYEHFEFDTVESAVGSYAPRTWGLPGKPCGTAYVHESGLTLWGNHNHMTYSFSDGLKKAVERLTGKKGVLHYDLGTKEEVTVEKEWSLEGFRPKKPGETDEDHACWVLGCEPEDGKAAAALLKKGWFVPGKVLRFNKQVCPSCKRDLERFDL